MDFSTTVTTPGPVADVNVPVGHGVQGPPSGPNEPGSHLQSVLLRLPADELEFAGHGLHVPALRYWPAAQRIELLLPY